MSEVERDQPRDAEDRWADRFDRLVERAERAEGTLVEIAALAEAWRYKGEFGWGPWQMGDGPDREGYVLDQASAAIRAVMAGRAAPGVRTCSGCGCTDEAACDGGCSWISADRCSSCGPVAAAAETRYPTCVEAWPECWSGGYDPSCCRFPKSCSCEKPACLSCGSIEVERWMPGGVCQPCSVRNAAIAADIDQAAADARVQQLRGGA